MNTKEMIEVMQAYESGKKIESSYKGIDDWRSCDYPQWDWMSIKYRVKVEYVDFQKALDHVFEGGTARYKGWNEYQCIYEHYGEIFKKIYDGKETVFGIKKGHIGEVWELL